MEVEVFYSQKNIYELVADDSIYGTAAVFTLSALPTHIIFECTIGTPSLNKDSKIY